MKFKYKKIAICASRKAKDMIDRTTKLGVEAYIEDVIRITKLPEYKIVENVGKAISELPDIFYYTTGEGADIIFKASRSAGIYDNLAFLMNNGTIFSRGYKTKSILLHNGFKNFQDIDSTRSFIYMIRDKDLSNTKVFVQMYGEELPELECFLKEKGAKMLKVWVYKYELDVQKIDAFIKKLLDDFYNAVVFTSAYQVDYLFRRAEELGLKEELSKVINGGLIIVAMGKVTVQRLRSYEVMKVYYPEKERFYYALIELRKAFENG